MILEAAYLGLGLLAGSVAIAFVWHGAVRRVEKKRERVLGGNAGSSQVVSSSKAGMLVSGSVSRKLAEVGSKAKGDPPATSSLNRGES